jgi:hypothetical protein
MTLTLETASYNSRRYGKPWIAKVIFEDNKPIFKFGDWIGAGGEEGILKIKCEEGDIIARGQKDEYKPRNSAATYFIFKDGQLSEEITKAQAYLHYTNNT